VGAEPVVAITGATGYVGGVLAERFAAQGFAVAPLVRAPGSAGSTARRYDLGQPLPPGALDGVDVLVHGAWDLKARGQTEVWHTNVDGTTRLLEAARRAGVKRVLFLSSMSAYPGTVQLYGLSKLAAEDAVLSGGGSVVRLGLVYGPRAGGMAGALAGLARLPVAPVVCARARQFTVHEDDMAEALVRLARARRVPGKPVGIAHPVGVPFRDVVLGMAALRGAKPVLVPVPSWAVYGALRAAEACGLRPGFRADSLLGLMRPAQSVPGQDVLDELGVTLRPFPNAAAVGDA